jgi:D-alanine-D-alanine ligase
MGVANALVQGGHRVVRHELDVYLAESLRTGAYDVVFPMVHGAVGEDGALQGLLEVLGIPYVGSDVLGSALAMHKRIARVLLEQAGLPVPKGIVVRRGEARPQAAAERARREVGARLVVKPSAQGSAIGVARIEADAPIEDVARAFEAVWAVDEYALAEHFARGREVTCGVLDLGAPRALPPTEIVSPHDAFYTYEARYAPGRSVHACPAALSSSLSARVQAAAVRAHAVLGCRDLSRADFVVGDEGLPESVALLEVNTLPGMTSTSLYPDAAAAGGLPMAQLCDALVRHAHARGPTPRYAPRPLPRVPGAPTPDNSS